MKDLFTASKEDRDLISKIAVRAAESYALGGSKVKLINIEMDLEACHCNGCPLRLQDLLETDDFNLMHDITGINRHLNHETGALERCFLPRFSAPQSSTKRRARTHE